MSARKAAEEWLDKDVTYSSNLSSIGKAIGIASRRLGYAVLDVADAQRDIAQAIRERKQAPVENDDWMGAD